MKRNSPCFFFSFRSPYSWIAARLIEEQLSAERTQIEYIPFWEPDEQTLSLLQARGGEFLYIPMSRQKHRYILQDIRRLTTKLGYRMAWPVDRDPWWDLPHLAYLAARRDGKEMEFFWAVYRARWEEGRDICSSDTIRALATEVGLDPTSIVESPNDQTIRQKGVEALYRCYRDDVFGVPFFCNRHARYWGVDRFDEFVASLTSGGTQSISNTEHEGGASATRSRDGGATTSNAPTASVPVELLERVGSYDNDHAGGCG